MYSYFIEEAYDAGDISWSRDLTMSKKPSMLDINSPRQLLYTVLHCGNKYANLMQMEVFFETFVTCLVTVAVFGTHPTVLSGLSGCATVCLLPAWCPRLRPHHKHTIFSLHVAHIYTTGPLLCHHSLNCCLFIQHHFPSHFQQFPKIQFKNFWVTVANTEWTLIISGFILSLLCCSLQNYAQAEGQLYCKKHYQDEVVAKNTQTPIL